MFYQLHWQQMEKIWKVICTASFYFIVTHYSTFRSLISPSLSPPPRAEKGNAAATHRRSRCVFQAEVCRPQSQQKSNYSWVFSLISISMQRFELWSHSQCLLYLEPWASFLQANNQHRTIVSALRSFVVPYLTTSPQSRDKVLFSQLTSGWC